MSNRDATVSGPSSRASSVEEPDNGAGKAASSSKKSSKTSKPRLTASQKNFNHKDAENKRRTAIRERFTELSQMVPGAMGQEKSEQVMLNKTTEYLKEMLEEQRRLEAIAVQQGIPIDDAGQLKDDDLGGPKWKPRNMKHYEASKLRRGDGSEQNAEDEDD